MPIRAFVAAPGTGGIIGTARRPNQPGRPCRPREGAQGPCRPLPGGVSGPRKMPVRIELELHPPLAGRNRPLPLPSSFVAVSALVRVSLLSCLCCFGRGSHQPGTNSRVRVRSRPAVGRCRCQGSSVVVSASIRAGLWPAVIRVSLLSLSLRRARRVVVVCLSLLTGRGPLTGPPGRATIRTPAGSSNAADTWRPSGTRPIPIAHMRSACIPPSSC